VRAYNGCKIGSTKQNASLADIEGCSVRATVRMTGVSKTTVMKLVADLGTACAASRFKLTLIGATVASPAWPPRSLTGHFVRLGMRRKSSSDGRGSMIGLLDSALFAEEPLRYTRAVEFRTAYAHFTC
jgi:hypothetical protein